MKQIVEIKYQLNRTDHRSIKEQLKEQKIKLVDVARKLEISKSYLNDMLTGRCEATEQLILFLKANNIKLTLQNVEIRERGLWG